MEDLGKLIVAKGFKKLPKVQKIAKYGHTECDHNNHNRCNRGAEMNTMRCGEPVLKVCVLKLYFFANMDQGKKS